MSHPLDSSLGAKEDVAISAPGKVLLAGGYLVLDRAFTGLVFGLSARIHVHIGRQNEEIGASEGNVVVRSPQFRGAKWTYDLNNHDDGRGVAVKQLGE